MNRLFVRIALSAALSVPLMGSKGCGAVREVDELCMSTGGTWDDSSPDRCWPAACSQSGPSCEAEAVKDGVCKCPADKPFWKDGEGCISKTECLGLEVVEAECRRTGGTWDEANVAKACAPTACGKEPTGCTNTSDAPVCLCPATRPYWKEGGGCYTRTECLDLVDEKKTCETSGGTWDEQNTARACQTGCGDTPGATCAANTDPVCLCPASAPYFRGDGYGCWTLAECNKVCTGTASACSAVSVKRCDYQDGCSHERCYKPETCRKEKTCTRAKTCYQAELCIGTEQRVYDCSYFYDCPESYDCSYDYDCSYYYDCGCEGTAKSCSSYKTPSGCGSQAGCTWQ